MIGKCDSEYKVRCHAVSEEFSLGGEGAQNWSILACREPAETVNLTVT